MPSKDIKSRAPTLRSLNKKMAESVKETDDRLETLESVIGNLDGKLDQLINSMVKSEPIMAKNNPHIIPKDSMHSEEAYQHLDENPIEFVKNDDPNIDAQVIEHVASEVNSAEFREKADQMAFDKHMLEIFVMASSSPYPDRTCTVSVNGIVRFVPRGIKIKLPRNYVEILARAKTSTYGNIETVDPINTTMTVDTPNHVIVHKNHLFFSFNGSAQHSGIGTPFIFSPIFGAAELATGDLITGFMSEPGAEGTATLGIYNRNTVHMLYGTSAATWNLVRFRNELGAFPYTLQQFGQTMYLDDRGLTTFRTVQAFGNFQQSTVSRHIQSFLNTKRIIANASCIARDKNQYRLFFTDKTSLYVTTEGKKNCWTYAHCI